jgi:hypothetical protein
MEEGFAQGGEVFVGGGSGVGLFSLVDRASY